MILKKVSKVVAMSLLMVSMLGENVSATETHYAHTYVTTGVGCLSSWNTTHSANTDDWYCRVDYWVSRTYEQCTACSRKRNIIDIEHCRHSDCIGADYDKIIYRSY